MIAEPVHDSRHSFGTSIQSTTSTSNVLQHVHQHQKFADRPIIVRSSLSIEVKWYNSPDSLAICQLTDQPSLKPTVDSLDTETPLGPAKAFCDHERWG